MSDLNSPLNLKLYGLDDEIKRELNRSIIPWGILERAIDLQDDFKALKDDKKGGLKNVSRDQIKTLTEFVIFIFDDQVTAEELNRGASFGDMFALYQQIFAMVSQVMDKNPTNAPTSPQENLKKVTRSRKRK